MGGLAAAAILAHRGAEVLVLEAAPEAGGKVGRATRGGVEFDTGPSLMTLPGILDDVLVEAGTSLDQEVSLRRLDPEFRYHYPDGTELDIRDSRKETLESIERAIGEGAARDLDEFLSYAKEVWEVAGPNFIFSEAPSWRTVASLGWSALSSIRSIDPLSTMESAITSRVKSEKLRHILRRFATYVGSDPRQAPATMNCIAWLEIGRGGYGVEGGMYELSRVLRDCASANGATFRFDTRVESLEMVRDRVTGVSTESGTISADLVISNADVSQLSRELIPESRRGDAPKSPDEPSMSGWTAVVKARRRSSEERPAHQVLFPEAYEEEFVDIFERDRAPRDPTVYLCAQEKAHGRTGWEDHEPVFVMANAPPEPVDGQRDAQEWEQLESRVMERAVNAGLLSAEDSIVWKRTPTDLAERFVASRGALYGAASNSAMAAFRRPPNELSGIDGLFLCGGSVHPGGGVPLCLQSGRLAVEKATEA